MEVDFSPAAARHKRKCDDSDAALELPHGVSLSSCIKKMRQEFGSTSYCGDDFLAGVPSPEIELHDQPTLLPTPDLDLLEESVEPLSSVPSSSERAIVLYKPVNPPLLPGGPNAGSQLTFTARMLPPGVLDASYILGRVKENDLPWLQAPKSGVTIVELSEEEASKHNVFQDNCLAMVPWDSNSTANMLASQSGIQPLSSDIDDMSADNENASVEAMEEDNEMLSMNNDFKPNNSSSDFCYESWQQYGVPQPQYSY